MLFLNLNRLFQKITFQRFMRGISNSNVKLTIVNMHLKRHTLSIHEKKKKSFDEHGIRKKQLFSCKFCEATRTSKQKLYIHLMGVHEGKKQFRCDINDCEYASNSKDGLEHHSLVIPQLLENSQLTLMEERRG